MSNERITTVKTRIIGNNHQVLRVDSETDKNLNKSDEQAFIDKIINLLSSKKIDVVIFEDYDKGNITENIITYIVEHCNKHNIPTTVDPKKRNFLNYKNVSLFKPNLKELREGLNIEINPGNTTEITQAVDALNELLNNKI